MKRALALLVVIATSAMFVPSSVAYAARPTLADYINRPGGRTIVIPDGFYRPGPTVDAPHAKRLVLRAAHRGRVVVDLAGQKLDLGSQTSNVELAGMTFVNGSVYVRGSDITLRYTNHLFPIDAWWAQGGTSGYYSAPRTLYLSGSTRARVIASDLHDTCTAIILGGARDARITAVHTYRLGPSIGDTCHTDSVGGAGGDWTAAFSDSYFEDARTMVANDNGSVGFTMVRTWLTSSPSCAVILSARRSWAQVAMARSKVRSWGNDCDTKVNYPERTHVWDSAITRIPPPWGAVDPATAWRRAQPYGA